MNPKHNRKSSDTRSCSGNPGNYPLRVAISMIDSFVLLLLPFSLSLSLFSLFSMNCVYVCVNNYSSRVDWLQSWELSSFPRCIYKTFILNPFVPWSVPWSRLQVIANNHNECKDNWIFRERVTIYFLSGNSNDKNK